MDGLAVLVLVCSVALAPLVGAVFIASPLRRRHRLVGLAPLGVVIGFFGSGLLGWAAVPAQWTASFWTTLDASVNAAKYGHLFEHAAERALIYYFFFPAEVGAIVCGLVAVFVLSGIPVPPSASTKA